MLANDYCNHFMTWQCRIRQIAMREDEGRPSQGMRPRVLDSKGHELSPGIVVLLVRENPTESTSFLKFQVEKYNDPQDIYKKALIFLQATHYQRSIEFSDEMTAIFSADSAFVKQLLIEEKCMLSFEQFNQSYLISCRTRLLQSNEDAHQASLWHNRVFNPYLGDDVAIIGFQPDWDETVIGNNVTNIDHSL